MADGSTTITTRKFWTTRELALIREHYPSGGLTVLESLLPGRSRSSIYQRAREMGAKSDKMVHVRQSWAHDPAIDESIRIAHQRPMKKGDVVALAKRVSRPVWWVSRRAREMGLTTPRFREPKWSPEEIELLRETREFKPEGAQRVFKRRGFNRTATAIQVQRKRNGILRDQGEDYTCHGIAAMIGHDPCTVLRWIRAGMLKAVPDTDCNARSDGRTTQYRVTERSLRDFILNHPIRLDLRKIPAAHTPWFIEMLTGRGCGLTAEKVS